ncbi:family 1 glycosylhydrolase [Burkholderia alba]|uniref:family 1 glycosylhydrolase n=1 Tax=Burkholderia alba TaxID=2683677 RepID=UPI002B05E07D|nr:family 1 glycosylhydrolase [Burkholderia alba]
MSEMLLRVHRDDGAPSLCITETGFAVQEAAPADGMVDDTPRASYLASYLAEALSAYRQGVRLKGVFCRAAFDSWEWASGFTKQFGLIHVDQSTQTRMPTRCLAYYSRCIASNTAM